MPDFASEEGHIPVCWLTQYLKLPSLLLIIKHDLNLCGYF